MVRLIERQKTREEHRPNVSCYSDCGTDGQVGRSGRPEYRLIGPHDDLAIHSSLTSVPKPSQLSRLPGRIRESKLD